MSLGSAGIRGCSRTGVRTFLFAACVGGPTERTRMSKRYRDLQYRSLTIKTLAFSTSRVLRLMDSRVVSRLIFSWARALQRIGVPVLTTAASLMSAAETPTSTDH